MFSDFSWFYTKLVFWGNQIGERLRGMRPPTRIPLYPPLPLPFLTSVSRYTIHTIVHCTVSWWKAISSEAHFRFFENKNNWSAFSALITNIMKTMYIRFSLVLLQTVFGLILSAPLHSFYVSVQVCCIYDSQDRQNMLGMWFAFQYAASYLSTFIHSVKP